MNGEKRVVFMSGRKNNFFFEKKNKRKKKKMEWRKAIFSTDDKWPVENVTVHVFYKEHDAFFVPGTSLGQGLGVNPETIPDKFIRQVPGDFKLDKRVRNVIVSGDLKACIKELLQRSAKQNVVDSVVDGIYLSILRTTQATPADDEEDDAAFQDDDEEEQNEELEENEEEPSKKKKKRTFTKRTRKTSPGLELVVPDEVRRIQAVIEPQNMTRMIDQFARHVEAIVKKHAAFETQQAAVLMLYNSEVFERRKNDLLDSKMRELGARIDRRVEQLERDFFVKWEKEDLPVKRAKWEQEAQARVEEEVRRTSLPKVQEAHIEQQAIEAARRVFSAELRKPLTSDPVSDDDLIRAMAERTQLAKK